MKTFQLPFRQIHLDFHTGPDIPDVGANFNAREFARVMKRAHVNSVTVFAKCHHGHLYYNSKRPERHPGLRRGLDLLGEQVDALHREGIRAPIYISVQCDEYAANTYPQWINLQPDSKLVGASPFNPGWQILDMNSPYQDFLAEQTEEVLKLFKPVDGIFFDMCWDQPSCSQWAVDAMLKANLNPEDEVDRKKHAHTVAINYMKRFHKMVLSKSKNATVYFNSRPLSNLAEEVPYLGQVEIEALPTGGWGYMYFPKNVRFARNFGKQYLGMTARFHKSWADFGGLKPYAALEYETSQMMAHGAKCSVGDQLHPRGTLDRGAYELIGKVFKRVEDREPWLVDAKPVTQIGLFQITGSTNYAQNANGTDEGATRMLTQLKHQFNVVNVHTDWSKFELLVLPDSVAVDKEFAAKLSKYVKAGGKLLVSGLSGLNQEGTKSVLPELGVKPLGASPYQASYIRFDKAFAQGVAPSDHIQYDRSTRVLAGPGAQVVARVVEPYFDRNWKHFCSHAQTPGDKASRYAAATIKGNVGYIAYPIFSSYANHGNIPYRQLVQNMLSRLLPDPLLTVKAPSSTEATVMKQGSRTIVHLLQYCPERRTGTLDILEDIVPIYSVELSVKLPREPKYVYIAPEDTLLPCTYADGRAIVTIPEIAGHGMIVFE